MSIAAYQRTAQKIETPVEREIRAFVRVINRLETADPADPLSLIPAIYENERLWTVLQVELADLDNALPADLRARLLGISIWALRHGQAVVAGQAELQPLIEVNKSIAAGLSAQAHASVPAAQAPVATAVSALG